MGAYQIPAFCQFCWLRYEIRCQSCARPLRVGVAYEVQKVAQLPADPWDVRLHQMITENGVVVQHVNGALEAVTPKEAESHLSDMEPSRRALYEKV